MIWTNVALVFYIGGLSLLFGGFWNFLLVQLPVFWLGGMFGIWLFYIQHQFEDVYWERDEHWNYVAAALLGASYYKLPKLLEWFTGNIGYHHIHHLSPRIPNYYLAECQRQSPTLQKWARIVTIPESLRAVSLKVYNEPAQRMENFPKGKTDEQHVVQKQAVSPEVR